MESHSTGGGEKGGGAAGAVPGSRAFPPGSRRRPGFTILLSLSLSLPLSRFLSLILFHTHTHTRTHHTHTSHAHITHTHHTHTSGCLRCPEACRLRLGRYTSSSTSAFWKGVEVRGGGPRYLKPKVETSISLEPWLGYHPCPQRSPAENSGVPQAPWSRCAGFSPTLPQGCGGGLRGEGRSHAPPESLTPPTQTQSVGLGVGLGADGVLAPK